MPPFGKKKNWPTTVRPRMGRPYTRCPICQEQVYPAVSKKVASESQAAFASAVALGLHKRSQHPEENDG